MERVSTRRKSGSQEFMSHESRTEVRWPPDTVLPVSRKAVRVVVVDESTGRHSGVWRIWARKNDLYIAPTDMGDLLKVSLHDGLWRVAFTSEHWATGESPRNAPGPGRSVWEIEHLPGVVDGVQHAWFIAIPPETLLRTSDLDSRVERVDSPRDGLLVMVNVWICAPEVKARPRSPIPPSPLALADGRSVWVGQDLSVYEVAAEPPTRPAVGTMIEFVKPEAPGDTPGFIVRTVDRA